MVVDDRMNGGKFLKASHPPETKHSVATAEARIHHHCKPDDLGPSLKMGIIYLSMQAHARHLARSFPTAPCFLDFFGRESTNNLLAI